jgi:hypothetical protein
MWTDRLRAWPLLLILAAACAHQPHTSCNCPQDPVINVTWGVHNAPAFSPCVYPNCRYTRGPNEPPDPLFPEYWTSSWTMYRVYGNYAQYPPPYNGAPPAGAQYETSYGASYYDSTYIAPAGTGAMMEHYEKKCIPIFPLPNDFTCSFISLGDIAYFLTYDDRPPNMPPVCLFSPLNHPPQRDFISHLPYSAGDSSRLGNGAQAYSFWVSAADSKPIQVGASPDQTNYPAILFGYAFAPVNGVLQPQSFYFSGYPGDPPNAPIVSQNYTNWSATKPDPAKTWDLVSKLDVTSLPLCHLFDPLTSGGGSTGTEAFAVRSAKRFPTWADIGRWKK